MNSIPADTTAEAAAKQFEILRRIGIEGRAKVTVQLCENLRKTVEAGVRQRHPEYGDKEVRNEVLRLVLGREIFRLAFEGYSKNR